MAIIPAKEPMAIIPAKEVRYLAFAGGGGKGIVLLGAVEAMEELLTAPLAKGPKIGGFAGASAGALIAMMLALHYDKKEMRIMLQNAYGRSSTDDIPWGVADAAYNSLPSGRATKVGDREEGWLNILKRRFVLKGRFQALVPDERVIGPVLEEIRRDLFIRESLANDPNLHKKLYKVEGVTEFFQGVSGGWVGGLQSKLVVGLFHPLAPLLVDSPETAGKIYEAARGLLRGDFAFLVRTRDEFDRYVCNFLLDQGLVPGLNLRNGVLRIARASPLLRHRLSALEVASLTFAELYRLAEVDLAVTGTNLSTSTWAYFSRTHTPDFPVVDAVALSMTYPMLFKPVWLDGEKTPPNYRGNWIDGGMLNNLPIHAFDRAPDKPLDHRMVAFTIEDPPDYSVKVSGHDMLIHNVSSLLDVLLAQATHGQLRTPLERLQTLRLKATGLSTLDLVPKWVLADRELIPAARDATHDYFQPTRACFEIVEGWRRQTPTELLPHLVFQELARNQLRGAFAHVSPGPMTVRPYRRKGDVRGDQGFEVDIIATYDGEAVKPEDRNYILYEAKASATAPVTSNQGRAIRLLVLHGGYISTSRSEEDDEEYRFFSDKAEISPQAVRVVRPANLCNEFTLAAAVGRAGAGAKRPFRPDLGKQSKIERGPGYPGI